MTCRTYESRGVWDAVVIAAVAVLSLAFGHAQQALADDDEGRVVEISPADGEADHAEQLADKMRDEADSAPAYWLGVEGSPIDSSVLRTHLQLADNVGVVVRQVVPQSPAQKAGLQEHDILIAVDGKQITDMGVLQQAVAASEGKPLELTVLRLAQEHKIEVTPEKRPRELERNFGGADVQGQLRDLPMGQLNEALKQLQGLGIEGNGAVRVFGPGMFLQGQQFNLGALPGGVAVTVTREGDGPAKITVKRGDQTWTVEGDDPAALKELPDDVRPFVEQMLDGGGGVGRFKFQKGQPRVEHFDLRVPAPQFEQLNDKLLKRVDELEKQMDRLQREIQEKISPPRTKNDADESKS